MNTTKQFVKLRGKALHCSRNIAFLCMQTTSDPQRKLILYSFTEKGGFTCSLTREGLPWALFPPSISPAFFLLPYSRLCLVNPEGRDASKAGYLGCRVYMWKCNTQGHEKWAPQQYWGLGAHPWRGTALSLIKFIILSLPLPLNLTTV